MTDDELDRRLRDALRAEPSPDLAARIRERIATTPAPPERWRWAPALAGGLAAAVIVAAVLATRESQPTGPSPRSAESTRAVAAAAAPGTASPRASTPDPGSAIAVGASTRWSQPARPRRSAPVERALPVAAEDGDIAGAQVAFSPAEAMATEASGLTLAPEPLSIPALDIAPLALAPLVVAPLLVAPLAVGEQIIEGGPQ